MVEKVVELGAAGWYDAKSRAVPLSREVGYEMALRTGVSFPVIMHMTMEVRCIVR